MNFKYRPEIDGLRAIAIISVVIYHAGFKIILNNIEYDLLPGGYLGVDIFYVISGYLITHLILDNIKNHTFSFFDFYERRARRLLPALFVVILFSILAGYILMLPSQLKDLSGSAISSLIFLSNFWFFFTDNYFGDSSNFKPLLHTWSLSIEEQFYLVFPPALYFLLHKKKKISFFFMLIIICSLIFSQLGSTYFKDFNFYNLISRIWELAFGSLIAYYHVENKIKKDLYSNRFLTLVAVVFILIPFFTFNKFTPHPSLLTIFTVLGTGIIIFCKNDSGIIKNFLSSKVLVSTGLISYSLYLWHYPVLAFKRIKSENLSEFDKLEAIFLALIFSIISFFLVEKPFRNKKFIKKKFFLTSIISFFLILTLTCIYITKSNGLPKRYSTEVLSLIDFNYEYKSAYQSGTCHIKNKIALKNIFFKNCKVDKNNNKKNLYIWGDSLGAHLYPGISFKYGENYNIWQRTTDACKPTISKKLFNNFKQDCISINQFILNEILKTKPDKIFLSGFWVREDLNEIKLIIEKLKNNNFNQIYLFGPSPRWHDPLPKILLKKFRLSRKIPEYLPDKNHKSSFILDQEFYKFAQKNDLKYVSPMKILCKKNYTCLTKVGDSAASITNWDENHFTKKASIFIFNKFID